MLHLVRNNSPYTVIILFIVTLLVKLQALSHPALPVVQEHHVLFSAVVGFFNFFFRNSAFAFTMLAAIMLYGQAIYLNAVSVKHRLQAKPTYVVAFLYILLTSLYPPFSSFSETLLVNWCLIAGIDMLLGFHQAAQPRKHIFNTGFVLSIAGILHFQAVAYLLLLFVVLLMLRTFNVGEWIVGIVGYLTPFYLYTAILFLVDKLPTLKLWPEIGMSLPRNISNPLYLIGTVVGVVILFFSGIYMLQGYMPKASVYMRRMWSSIAAFLFMSIAVAIGTDISETSIWLVAMPALSLIIAPALSVEKTKWFSNFAFYFSLLLVLFCQLAIK